MCVRGMSEDKPPRRCHFITQMVACPFYDVAYEPAVMKDGKIVNHHYHLEADAKRKPHTTNTLLRRNTKHEHMGE